MTKISLAAARRIALSAQGIGSPPQTSPNVRSFRTLFRKIGLLQLDSVNVLCRSHYLPVLARLGPYDRGRLHRYTTTSGEIFEYWGHEASLLPIELYPMLRFRMDAMPTWRRILDLMEKRPGYIDEVYKEVARRGPITVGDLDQGGDRTGPWWGYAPGKVALEWLFACGRITAYRNERFGREYDLPERVLPPEVMEQPALQREEAYRNLLMLGAKHHGIGTADDIMDYYRLHKPTARPIFEQLVAEGELRPFEVDGWGREAYLHPEAKRPRTDRGTALLSPFDPVVWYRERAERLFDFHYRIEIYVPKPKRVFGYYVLPFLLDGALVGRVDLKADRQAGVLRAQASHVENIREQRRVAAAMATELATMADWLGLNDVIVERKGNLAIVLRKTLT